MPSQYIRRLWQSFQELNLFKKPSSNAGTSERERLATRIYIYLLIVLLLALATISALIVHSIERLERTPSPVRFSQLVHAYPDTLNCPCSKFGIIYDSFVSLRVQFHQVCSSHFVQQASIDAMLAEQNKSAFAEDDVRATLPFFWQTIAGLCIASNKTWIDTVTAFGGSQIVSPAAVSEHTLQSQVHAALDNQLSVAQATLAWNLLAIRSTITGNQMVSALATNFHLGYASVEGVTSDTPKMLPRTFDNCSCLNREGCPRPALVNDSYDRPVLVPGMAIDCLIVDGTLGSTLACYYDRSCVTLLHKSLSTWVEPLSNWSNRNFAIDSSVQELVNELMLDEKTTDIHFDDFYSQCNPALCTYSYYRRFDILFIVTTILGIFGGLSFVLRLIAPIIAKIILRRKNRVSPVDRAISSTSNGRTRRELNYFHTLISFFVVSVIVSHLRSIPGRAYKTMVTLNLFERHTPRTPVNISREIYLTRAFLLLLSLCAVTSGFYLFLLVQNQVVMVTNPSHLTYEQLYNEHPSTLQCPCAHLSVRYGEFLNVTFVLHQVCSSHLVSPAWLNYLALFDTSKVPPWTETGYSRDFRSIGSSYFQLLATFCSLAEININDAQRSFYETRFINEHVLAPPLFTQQSLALTKEMVETTRNHFSRVLDWINIVFIESEFLTGTNINSYFIVKSDGRVETRSAQLFIFSRIDDDGGVIIRGDCFCAVFHGRCFLKSSLHLNGSRFHDSNQFLEQIPTGCVPLSGFLQSSMAWWYNETYLNTIRATYEAVISAQPSPNATLALDVTVPTRFFKGRLKTLVDEMLLESSIINDTSFERYYNACAPNSCSYTVSRRRNLIVVITLFISVCGGLNRALQLLVPVIGKIVFVLMDRCKHRAATDPIRARCQHLRNRVSRSIRRLNLFETIDADETQVEQQILYTRIYLVLFGTVLGLLLFYSAIVERSITRTTTFTSVEDYESHVDLYPDGIKCPCSRVSIPYGEFMTQLQVASFHQVCSTNVINTVLQEGEYRSPCV